MEPNNGPNHPLKPPKKNQQCIELRFLIPGKAAGSVIGKSGENIRNLRRIFCGRINVSDNNGPERVLSLEADLEAVLDILAQILEKMEGIVPLPRAGSGDSNEYLHHVDLRMLVHQSLVGALIGKGGGRINDLREKCELRLLKVYQTVCPESTDRIVQMVGSIPLVIDCIGKIVDMCKDTPVREPKINYDAQNYNNISAAHYGGWTVVPAVGPGSTGNNPRSDLTRSMGFSRSSGYSSSKTPVSNSGYKSDGYDYNPNSYASNYNDQDHEFKEMKLPHKVVGAIIGPGGSRIRQVRMESGAHIIISSHDRSPQERIVTVQGNAQQVKRACTMINECLNKFMN